MLWEEIIELSVNEMGDKEDFPLRLLFYKITEGVYHINAVNVTHSMK